MQTQQVFIILNKQRKPSLSNNLHEQFICTANAVTGCIPRLSNQTWLSTHFLLLSGSVQFLSLLCLVEFCHFRFHKLKNNTAAFDVTTSTFSWQFTSHTTQTYTRGGSLIQTEFREPQDLRDRSSEKLSEFVKDTGLTSVRTRTSIQASDPTVQCSYLSCSFCLPNILNSYLISLPVIQHKCTIN